MPIHRCSSLESHNLVGLTSRFIARLLFCSGYEKSIATINSLRANSRFNKLLDDKRDELKGRGLMTFLIMPVQRYEAVAAAAAAHSSTHTPLLFLHSSSSLLRLSFSPCFSIPRYVLLLRELKKHTPPGHPEHDQLNYALTKIESIAAHVNENKRHVENMSKLLDIQSRVSDPKFVLFQPDRRLLREGVIKRLKER